jgi:hypothetical protein
LHYSAVQAAWNILCNRLLNTAEPLPEQLYSNFMDNSEGMRIKSRLIALKDFSRNFSSNFPSKLRARLGAAFLYNDTWATPQLKRIIQEKIEEITTESNDWFQTLPPVKRINYSDRSTIILIDGISIDVWLEVFANSSALFSDAITGIHRLSAQVLLLTVSMNFLVFRPKATLPRDWQIFKLTILRSQVMKTICGKILFPNHHMTNPSLSEISFFDEQAHAGNIRLHEMPAMLQNLLTRNIPPLLDLCKSEKRTLVMTSDHGFHLLPKAFHMAMEDLMSNPFSGLIGFRVDACFFACSNYIFSG